MGELLEMVEAGERTTAGLRSGAEYLDVAELRFRGAGRGAGVLVDAAAAARRGFLVTVVVITGGREVAVDAEVRCGRWESEEDGGCCFREPGFLLVVLLLFVAVIVELETADWRDDGRGLDVKVEEAVAALVAVGADEEREEEEAVEGIMLLLLLTVRSLGWASLLLLSSSFTVVTLETFGLRARIFLPGWPASRVESKSSQLSRPNQNPKEVQTSSNVGGKVLRVL